MSGQPQLLCMSSGDSHIDAQDHKPKSPVRGNFRVPGHPDERGMKSEEDDLLSCRISVPPHLLTAVSDDLLLS